MAEEGLFVQAIVVAHDSASQLRTCLEALAANGVPALVVDNASADRSAELAESMGASVLRLPANEGYGRANNRGVEVSRAEYVLLANPDVVLDPGAARELHDAARRYPGAGLLAPRIVEPDGRVFWQPRSLLAPYLPNPRGRRATPDGDCCAPFLSGACLFVRRDLFVRIGGFDPAIFLFYEDDDLCRRVADAGFALVHVHAAVARHGRGRSSAPRPGRVYTARWHQAWSRGYVARKWGMQDVSRSTLVVNAAKAMLALATFRRSSVERYAGSAGGAWAFLRGRTATGRQGLRP